MLPILMSGSLYLPSSCPLRFRGEMWVVTARSRLDRRWQSRYPLPRKFRCDLFPTEEEMRREYTDEEIQRFLEEDKLDPELLAKARTLLEEAYRRVRELGLQTESEAARMIREDRDAR